MRIFESHAIRADRRTYNTLPQYEYTNVQYTFQCLKMSHQRRLAGAMRHLALRLHKTRHHISAANRFVVEAPADLIVKLRVEPARSRTIGER